MTKRGHIYFMQPAEGGPIKIGFTVNGVAARLQKIQANSPVELRVIASFEAWFWTELKIHRVLRAARLHGEWFEDCPSVRRMIALCEAPGDFLWHDDNALHCVALELLTETTTRLSEAA